MNNILFKDKKTIQYGNNITPLTPEFKSYLLE